MRARVVETFLDIEHLESWPIGVEVRYVQGVAVAQAGRVKTFAVVVQNHGTEDDLITAVIVHIRDAQLMFALPAIPAVLFARVAVEDPPAG